MIQDWLNANSKEDLLKLGKFTEVRAMIKKDLREFSKDNFGKKDEIFKFIIITSNSTNGLLKKITNLREFINKSGEIIKDEENSNEDFFKSKAHEYIYYLTELDGEERINKLKIYKSHYLNKDVAKKWYREISKEIHPDKLIGKKLKNLDKAMAELSAIYREMVDSE